MYTNSKCFFKLRFVRAFEHVIKQIGSYHKILLQGQYLLRLFLEFLPINLTKRGNFLIVIFLLAGFRANYKNPEAPGTTTDKQCQHPMQLKVIFSTGHRLD